MPKKIEEIKALAEKAQLQLTGPLGVGFTDLTTGESYFHNGDKLFPTASIFKIFVLAELFRKVFEGEISLEDRFPLEECFKAPGSGILFQMREGTNYTIYDYAFLMMSLSDNTAADFLYKLTGRENIYTNVINPLELKNTKIDFNCADLFTYYCGIDPKATAQERTYTYLTGDFFHTDYYKCTQEKNDVTTPVELSKFYLTLFNGKWCSPKTSKDLLDLMKKCQTNSRIPKYLPSGTSVAHKTGTFDRLVNDSGIVYTEKGAYILTMMYNGNMADENEYYKLNEHGFYGEDIIAHLSRDIFDVFVK